MKTPIEWLTATLTRANDAAARRQERNLLEATAAKEEADRQEARKAMIREQFLLLETGAEIAPPWVLEPDYEFESAPLKMAEYDLLLRDIWFPFIQAMTPDQRAAYFAKWRPPRYWPNAIYVHLRDLGDSVWSDRSVIFQYWEADEHGGDEPAC
jgi:hypothetical protein